MNAAVRTVLGALLVLAAAGAPQAQPSTKPVTFVVPFSAGGQADVIGRQVAAALQKTMQQTTVVENISGAGGAIAARRVLEAPADGHMVFEASPSQLILAGLVNRDIKFRSEDFRAIHMIGTSPYAIMVRSDLPARSVDELAVLAREEAKKGKPLTYASVGVGTLNHLLGEELSRRIDAPMVHVPYKGGADVMRDLVGGRVDLLLNIYTSQQIAMAQDGRFRFLAAMSPSRQPPLPQVPSVDESTALKDFHTEIWTGVFVRRDTPESIVSKLNKAMAAALEDPALRNSLMELGGVKAASPTPSPATVAKEYADGIEQFRGLARRAGLQAQQ